MPIPTPNTSAATVKTASKGNWAVRVIPTRPTIISTGPATSAMSSRRPDHPDTAKVPAVQPKDRTMETKLMNSGVTPWTT